jgi:hypothetical protein
VIAALLVTLVVQFSSLAQDGPARRDFRGHLIRCVLPRAYPDPRAPNGVRFEGCGRNTCPTCVLEKILTLIHAINLFPLTQSGVVTLAPDHEDDHLACAKRLRTGTNAAFRSAKAETGVLVPRATIVEVSEAGRVHLHLVTRGSKLSRTLFTDACRKAGLGFADLQRVGSPSALSRYLYKSVLPPHGEPLIADERALKTFLGLNAGRVINTRGPFWVDRDGAVLGSSVEACKMVHREWRGNHGPEASAGD